MNCLMCGAQVRVIQGDEGTAHYQPTADVELRETLANLDEILVAYNARGVLIESLEIRVQGLQDERDEARRQHTAAGKQHVAAQESLREALKRAETQRDYYKERCELLNSGLVVAEARIRGLEAKREELLIDLALNEGERRREMGELTEALKAALEYVDPDRPIDPTAYPKWASLAGVSQ